VTPDLALLSALLILILVLLLWGRIRHDLLAAGGLLTAVVLGLVPEADAFSGFANPAVVIVALVLVASRALENSGVLGLLTQWAGKNDRGTGFHIAVVGGLGAALSAVINNVAALALLMPFDVQAARKAGRPPGVTLMPLSFATILGGMVTLIGTPPNIIVASVRQEQLGSPYTMFDFTPVGLAVAVVGVLFVALIGWRLVPGREDPTEALTSETSFEAELVVPEESPIIGRVGIDLDEETEKADVILVSILRGGKRSRTGRLVTIKPEDVLVVKGSSDAIGAFIKATGLQEPQEEEDKKAEKKPRRAKSENGEKKEEDAVTDNRPAIIEAVVRSDSILVGRTAAGLSLRPRFGITLLGLGRAGRMARQQVRNRQIEPGDVLLVTGRGAASNSTLDLLGLIPINRIGVAAFKARDAVLAIGLFAAAVIVATAGILSFTVSIAIAVAAYAALRLVPAREFYERIEWPVVVMLACLLPIGAAFERVGGTALIADTIASATQGYSPVVALVAVMIVTMTLSDVLNNVATIVISGPIAIDLAQRLGANPDTFLMGVAIAASCAFLTPIGHKNNTLVMGPGGFRFSDYWRMGLPLEIVVLCVSVPMLLIVWPL
jgi:di/tricarboxylate transporter